MTVRAVLRVERAGIGLALIFLSFAAACGGIATIRPAFSLPPQELNSASRSGTTRVIFFNDSNSLLYGIDGSGKVNALLDGENLASINIREYVQIDLEPREYQLTLKHRDFAVFSSTHAVGVESNPLFVEITCTPTSHQVRTLQQMPDGFTQRFKSASQR